MAESLLDYGAVQRPSAYGDPNDFWGQIGNRFQNFAQGAAKISPLAMSLGTVNPALGIVAAVGGGIWNAFAAEDTQNKAREAEIENARRAREAYLQGKQFLNDQEKEQLALFDRQIKTLEQNYENQKALQSSILARQQQAAQFGYGGALGATGMSYAAAQPGLMRGLAARGMLGTGAEAAARAGLAGQRAAAIERAAQNYNDILSQAYQADARTRSGLLDALSTNQAAIDANRTNFNRRMADARFNLQQGNTQETYNLIDQARKNAAETQQQRGSDIFKGIVDVAGSSAFQSAMGAAFGPKPALSAEGLSKSNQWVPGMVFQDGMQPAADVNRLSWQSKGGLGMSFNDVNLPAPTTALPASPIAAPAVATSTSPATLFSGRNVDELQKNQNWEPYYAFNVTPGSGGRAGRLGDMAREDRLPTQFGGGQTGRPLPPPPISPKLKGLPSPRFTDLARGG